MSWLCIFGQFQGQKTTKKGFCGYVESNFGKIRIKLSQSLIAQFLIEFKAFVCLSARLPLVPQENNLKARVAE